jgi:2-C-methyl-D-erythritol 4-phosphate cytidylyltransferase
VAALAAAEPVRLVVVAAPPGEETAVAAMLADASAATPVRVVTGGASRADSVAAALAALPTDVDVVLVHDAARPLVPVTLIDRVVAAVQAGHGAVVPAIPLADTVRRVGPDGAVVETPDRASLRAVQTPQGFTRALLDRAYAAAPDLGDPPQAPTDDAGLVERLGVPVHLVPGDPEAFKVTTPLDLRTAEAVLAARSEVAPAVSTAAPTASAPTPVPATAAGSAS